MISFSLQLDGELVNTGSGLRWSPAVYRSVTIHDDAESQTNQQRSTGKLHHAEPKVFESEYTNHERTGRHDLNENLYSSSREDINKNYATLIDKNSRIVDRYSSGENYHGLDNSVTKFQSQSLPEWKTHYRKLRSVSELYYGDIFKYEFNTSALHILQKEYNNPRKHKHHHHHNDRHNLNRHFHSRNKVDLTNSPFLKNSFSKSEILKERHRKTSILDDPPQMDSPSAPRNQYFYSRTPFTIQGGPLHYQYTLDHVTLRWTGSHVGSEHSLQNAFFPAEVRCQAYN